MISARSVSSSTRDTASFTKSGMKNVPSGRSRQMTRLSGDRRNAFEDAINLGRSDSHAETVQGRVGAAVDETPAARVDLQEVAMAPDAGEVLEIRFTIAPVAGVVPKPQRHRRCGASHDEFADASSRSRPRSSQACTSIPRRRVWISPAYTGRSGEPPTSPAHSSVPPDGEFTHKSSFTLR